jgi:hypothetical protein
MNGFLIAGNKKMAFLSRELFPGGGLFCPGSPNGGFSAQRCREAVQ